MQNVEFLKTRYNRGKGGTKKMCVVLSNIVIRQIKHCLFRHIKIGLL